LPAIGLLIGLQSLFLYSSVARLPVALALLAFNTYPIWTALLAWLIYRQTPERGVVLAMPVILIGLSMALDVFGAASGLGAAGQWGGLATGVAFACGCGRHVWLGAGADPTRDPGSGRPGEDLASMGMAGLVALGTVGWQGGFHLPQVASGWWGWPR
jgi:drug/metabolite transporter (DMT)-like permease